jgi:polar amino acid transport system substrate-binding protein
MVFGKKDHGRNEKKGHGMKAILRHPLTTALTLICALASAPAFSEEMTFVTGGMSPPYAYEEDGKIVGMDTEVLTRFLRSKGVTPTFRAVPWKRALAEAQQGQVHGIFSLFKSDEREAFLYYPDTPINSVRTVVVGRKADNLTINGLEDLKGLRVGVLHAYKYGPEFDNMTGLNKIFCRDKQELITLLDRERVTVAMDSADVFNFKAKEYGFDLSKFEFLHQVQENPIFVAFSKTGLGERGRRLAAEFGDYFQQLEASGELEKIRNPYR